MSLALIQTVKLAVYLKENISLFLEQNQSILIIFVIQHPEETCHQKVINLPTSLIKCCRTTFGSAKVIFQQYSTVILIKQLTFEKIKASS